MSSGSRPCRAASFMLSNSMIQPCYGQAPTVTWARCAGTCQSPWRLFRHHYRTPRHVRRPLSGARSPVDTVTLSRADQVIWGLPGSDSVTMVFRSSHWETRDNAKLAKTPLSPSHPLRWIRGPSPIGSSRLASSPVIRRVFSSPRSPSLALLEGP